MSGYVINFACSPSFTAKYITLLLNINQFRRVCVPLERNSSYVIGYNCSQSHICTMFPFATVIKKSDFTHDFRQSYNSSSFLPGLQNPASPYNLGLFTLFSTCRVIFQQPFSNPFSLLICGPGSLHIYTFLRVVHPHEYLFSSCTMAAFCIQSPITRLFTTLRHFISDDVICLRYLFLSARHSEPCRFFSRVSLTVTVFL